MSPVMFIVGSIIFAAYLYFLIWNIFYNAKKNKEENYPGDYYNRHKQPQNPHTDMIDMDGMGNFSRFPSTEPKPRKRPKKNKTKTKERV